MKAVASQGLSSTPWAATVVWFSEVFFVFWLHSKQSCRIAKYSQIWMIWLIWVSGSCCRAVGGWTCLWEWWSNGAAVLSLWWWLVIGLGACCGFLVRVWFRRGWPFFGRGVCEMLFELICVFCSGRLSLTNSTNQHQSTKLRYAASLAVVESTREFCWFAPTTSWGLWTVATNTTALAPSSPAQLSTSPSQ